MSRFQILADELNNDPLGRGYAGQTDAQAAADINTEYRDVNYPVSVADLEVATRESLKWAEYRERQVATVPETGQLVNPAMSEFMDIFFTTSSSGAAEVGGGIDLQGPYMSGLIDRMVAEGSLGSGAADALRNYGVRTVSRGTELGIGTVSEGEVSYARTL